MYAAARVEDAPIEKNRKSTRLKIKVVPGASASGIAGWLGDSLKVRVSAPPEKGLANKAVEALLCELLEIPSATIRIVSGRSSAHKLVQIDSLSAAELRSRLSRYS